MTFTRQVREELAHGERGSEPARLAEASAMLRFGGALQIRGQSGVGYLIETDVGAVGRRLRATLAEVLAVTPDLEVHRPTGLRGVAVLRLRLDAPPPAALGIMDEDGLPVGGIASRLTESRNGMAAYVRGALMVAGSVSAPRRAAHLEVRAPGEAAARGLAGLMAEFGVAGVRACEHDGWRVTAKSGAAIGALLARLGAHTAFLQWDGERLRRELRGGANRAANADRANVSRAVVASSRQSASIERVMRSPQWAHLPEEVRAVALARLASPEASLADLGALLDPPVGKSTVHRRLAALVTVAEELDLAPGSVE